MKTLLWKDFRQNQQTLFGVGIILALPYLLLISMSLLHRFSADYQMSGMINWPDQFNLASLWSTALSVIMFSFISGNAIAGERADRSAEFASYLPISRTSAITSKAILAVGLCLFIWIANESVLLMTRRVPLSGSATEARLRLMGATSVLIFGVSWLSSTISKSSAQSAAAGIGAVVGVAWGNMIAWRLLGINVRLFSHSYAWACIIIGILCFFGGVAHYLRRSEP